MWIGEVGLEHFEVFSFFVHFLDVLVDECDGIFVVG
jgi:hypothetical protein